MLSDHGKNDAVKAATQEKKGRLLIVDDEEAVRQALKRLFRRDYDVEVIDSGAGALQILQHESFDLIISDMRMPLMTGAELLKNCYQLYPQMIRILLTGFSDLESTISAVNEGKIYRYMTKPWDNDELKAAVADALEVRDLRNTNQSLNAHVARQNNELERLNKELQQKYEQSTHAVTVAESKLEQAYSSLRDDFNNMVHILVAMMEMRNKEGRGCTEKQADLARKFAEAASFDKEKCQDVYYAALLKNIGKITLPDAILTKSLPNMNRDERYKYAHFSLHGEGMLSLLGPLQNAAKIVRSHTELLNGKGFPDHLSGEAIIPEARLLRIVSDYLELQREHNFIGERLTEADARSYLNKMAGQRYDRDLMAIFDELLDQYDSDFAPEIERLPLNDVKEGMVLAENLVSPAGVVLLARDTQLTERHLAKLKNLMWQFKGQTMLLHVVHQPEAAEAAAES